MPNDRGKEVRSVQQESDREERIFTFKVTQLIWLLLGILEALIALRSGLKLISANPAGPEEVFEEPNHPSSPISSKGWWVLSS